MKQASPEVIEAIRSRVFGPKSFHAKAEEFIHSIGEIRRLDLFVLALAMSCNRQNGRYVPLKLDDSVHGPLMRALKKIPCFPGSWNGEVDSQTHMLIRCHDNSRWVIDLGGIAQVLWNAATAIVAMPEDDYDPDTTLVSEAVYEPTVKLADIESIASFKSPYGFGGPTRFFYL